MVSRHSNESILEHWSVTHRSCAQRSRQRTSMFTHRRRPAHGGHTGPLGEPIARAVLDNLYRFVLPAAAGPRRLVPLPALATKHLSGARSVSLLTAQKGDDRH